MVRINGSMCSHCDGLWRETFGLDAPEKMYLKGTTDYIDKKEMNPFLIKEHHYLNGFNNIKRYMEKNGVLAFNS